MSEPTPKETHEKMFVGEAVGGPKSGEIIRHPYLTKFEPRTPLPINYNDADGSSSPSNREKMKHNMELAKIPHRYDYDLDKGIWVYVQYTPAELARDFYWELGSDGAQ